MAFVYVVRCAFTEPARARLSLENNTSTCHVLPCRNKDLILQVVSGPRERRSRRPLLLRFSAPPSDFSLADSPVHAGCLEPRVRRPLALL
jgi:hypothetical protein